MKVYLFSYFELHCSTFALFFIFAQKLRDLPLKFVFDFIHCSFYCTLRVNKVQVSNSGV